MNLQLSNTKLLKLWQIIFAEGQIYEIKSLRHYTDGCYPRDAKPLLLFDFLTKYAPVFSHDKMTATAAYLHTFKQKRLAPKDVAAAETALKLVISALFQRTEAYIIQAKALHDAQYYPNANLMELYAHAALKTCFEDYWRKAQPIITQPSDAPQQGFRYLYERFLTQKAYNDYCLQMQYFDRLDWQAQTNALRDCVNLYILQHRVDTQTFQIDYHATTDEAQLSKYDILLEVLPTDPPLLAIYKSLTLSLNTENWQEKEDSTTQALQLLETHQLLFNTHERADIFSLVANCIGDLLKHNRFNDDYYKILLKLYKLRETGGVLLNPDGTIGLMNFKNIVTVALTVNELAFAKQFTDTYHNKLPQLTAQQRTDAQEIHRYNLANIAFFEKKYTEVAQLLRFNEAQNSILSLDTEVLILKTYFEQDLQTLHGKYLTTPERPSSFLIRLQQFEQRVSREKAANSTMYQNFVQILLAFAEIYTHQRIGTKITLPEDFTATLFHNHTPTLEERWLRKCAKFE